LVVGLQPANRSIPGRAHERVAAGFALVDPVAEAAAREAREAEQAALERAKVEEAAQAAEAAADAAAGGKRKKAAAAATAASQQPQPSRRGTGLLTLPGAQSGDASAVNTARSEAGGASSSALVSSSSMSALPASVSVKKPTAPARVATRWIIPPRGSVTVHVSFTSPVVGQFASSLGFEIVGAAPGPAQELSLPVQAAIAVPEISQDPRSIFMSNRRVGGKNRGGANKPAFARAFNAEEKIYEFGPLLVGKDPDGRHHPLGSPAASTAPSNGQVNNNVASPISIGNGLTLVPQPTRKTHADVWRITNSGPFATHIDLSFLQQVDSHGNTAGAQPANTGDLPARRKSRNAQRSKDASSGSAGGAAAGEKAARSPSPSAKGQNSAAAAGAAGAGGAKGAKVKGGLSEKELKALEKVRAEAQAEEERRWDVLRSKAVFTVEPCAFDLAVDESRDITVWAFPQTCTTISDTLVATIRDNPAPVQLPLRCTGARPSASLDVSEVNFERLLLNKRERRTVSVQNTGVLPVAWNLTGLEALPGDEVLTVGPVTSGILAPGAPPTTLVVDFFARDERAFAVPLAVEVRDVEGFLGVLDTLPLMLRCESYQNKAHLSFPAVGGAAVSSSSAKDKHHQQQQQLQQPEGRAKSTLVCCACTTSLMPVSPS